MQWISSMRCSRTTTFKISDQQDRRLGRQRDRLETDPFFARILISTFVTSHAISGKKDWYFESRASRTSIWHGGSSEKQSGPDTLTIDRVMRDCKIILVSFIAVNTKRSRTHVPLFQIIRLSNIHFKWKETRSPNRYLINVYWLSLGMS